MSEGRSSSLPATLSEVVSGQLSDSPTDSEFLQTTAAVVLAKPLGIDALLERVRRLLTTR
jgi:hypothetical protein